MRNCCYHCCYITQEGAGRLDLQPAEVTLTIKVFATIIPLCMKYLGARGAWSQITAAGRVVGVEQTAGCSPWA
jgi:hypothetical protein